MIKKLYTSNYNEQLALCHILCTSALLPFSARKFCIISTWSGFAIYLFRIIPPALALLYGNCPLAFKLRSYFVFLQKLSSEVFCKKKCGRTPLLQSCFNKAGGLRPGGSVKRRLQCACLSFGICKIFESIYFEEHLSTTVHVSLNFDILLVNFLYSVSFVICIYLNYVTDQTFCKLYLLFNVRNLFYLLTYLLWDMLTDCRYSYEVILC